jgi:hypothetical protein
MPTRRQWRACWRTQLIAGLISIVSSVIAAIIVWLIIPGSAPAKVEAGGISLPSQSSGSSPDSAPSAPTRGGSTPTVAPTEGTTMSASITAMSTAPQLCSATNASSLASTPRPGAPQLNFSEATSHYLAIYSDSTVRYVDHNAPAATLTRCGVNFRLDNNGLQALNSADLGGPDKNGNCAADIQAPFKSVSFTRGVPTKLCVFIEPDNWTFPLTVTLNNTVFTFVGG